MVRGIKRETAPRARKVSTISGVRIAVTPEPLNHIVFTGMGTFVVAGSESGQVYCFTPQDPEQMIDAKDTDSLMKTGLFRMKS